MVGHMGVGVNIWSMFESHDRNDVKVNFLFGL